MFDVPASDCIRMSGKLGTNVESVLQEVVRRLPPPKIEKGSPLKALLFDSTFDHYRGVVAASPCVEVTCVKAINRVCPLWQVL
ncbi:translation factor Guf1, mitochondrial-like [Phyllobates terribilis]|uniref:translation factor Guf1, mitochondrial-like n=1 Tax=Phyllobates terribilis TaxID=111132 RepID=UPI003CCB15D9